jgi:hypothetical protein
MKFLWYPKSVNWKYLVFEGLLLRSHLLMLIPVFKIRVPFPNKLYIFKSKCLNSHLLSWLASCSLMAFARSMSMLISPFTLSVSVSLRSLLSFQSLKKNVTLFTLNHNKV